MYRFPDSTITTVEDFFNRYPIFLCFDKFNNSLQNIFQLPEYNFELVNNYFNKNTISVRVYRKLDFGYRDLESQEREVVKNQVTKHSTQLNLQSKVIDNTHQTVLLSFNLIERSLEKFLKLTCNLVQS